MRCFLFSLFALLMLLAPGATLPAQQRVPRPQSGRTQATPPQAAPDVPVCEGARVSLGQTKQEVQSTIALCCQIEQTEINGIVDANSLRVTGRRDPDCLTLMRFDASEKLVWAEHEWPGRGSDAMAVWNDLFPAFSDLLRDSPADSVPSGPYTQTQRIAQATVMQGVLTAQGYFAGGVYVRIGQRTLHIGLIQSKLENATIGPEVSLEIGDVRDAVFSAVPVKK